jgi:hypothetical protein
MITIGAILLGTASLLYYQRTMHRWTVVYDGRRIVHGTYLTPLGHRYRDSLQRAEKEYSDSVLAFEASGSTELMWDASDRLRNSQVIAIVYLGLTTLFATALVSAAQVGYCASRKR